jgi:hypothetical protein
MQALWWILKNFITMKNLADQSNNSKRTLIGIVKGLGCLNETGASHMGMQLEKCAPVQLQVENVEDFRHRYSS